LTAADSNGSVLLSSIESLIKLYSPDPAAPSGGRSRRGFARVTVMADQIHNLNDSTTTNTPTAGDPAAAESPPPPKGRGGVRTQDGKRSARGNAVKDSLRSKVVFTPAMAAAIAVLKQIFTTQFQPQTEYEQMLISDMAIAKAKLDHAGELLLLDGERVVERAVDFWDVDQTASALAISRSLSRNPERTVHTLGNTKKGA